MTPSEYVIFDACLARSVGSKPTPKTREIRSVTETLKAGSIGVCITPLLRQEWEKHASPHMRRWLVHMTSRGRVKIERDRQVRDFRLAVRACFGQRECDHEKNQEVLKDAHLTECAILTGRAVLSGDDTQRRILAELSVVYPRVGSVQWINPTLLYQGCVRWLEGGGADAAFGRVA